MTRRYGHFGGQYVPETLMSACLELEQAWIDAKGRVRRLALTMSLGAAQLGTPMTMTMTEDLYDFGARADITLPTDDLVVDLSSLAGSGS